MSEAGNHIIDYAAPSGGQPLHSRIVFEAHADGISYMILPQGLAGAALSLILLGIPLALLLVVVGLLLWVGLFEEPALLFAALTVLFLATPLGLIWALIYRAARRPTVISVRAGEVRLFSGAAMFRRVKTWPADQVAAIDVMVTGVTRQMRPSADMKMRLHKQPIRKLIIAGHDSVDLQWMATGMRSELGIDRPD